MRRSRRSGMGAVRLLGAMLAVLAAAFGFYYWVNAKAESSKRVVTIRRVAAIEAGLQKYCVDCGGALPTAKQGLDALYRQPTRPPVPQGWRGPYLQSPEALRDGWGREFKYMCPGRPIAAGSSIMRPFDLASYGKDGCEGGKGLDRDICNWDRGTMIP